MDRLDEIRARCERAKREEYPEKVYGSAAYYCITEDIPFLLAEVERLNGDYDEANRAYHEWFEEAQKETTRAEKAEAALSDMRFAYVNKDPGTSHQFEEDALKAAADILGEWPPKEGE